MHPVYYGTGSRISSLEHVSLLYIDRSLSFEPVPTNSVRREALSQGAFENTPSFWADTSTDQSDLRRRLICFWEHLCILSFTRISSSPLTDCSLNVRAGKQMAEGAPFTEKSFTRRCIASDHYCASVSEVCVQFLLFPSSVELAGRIALQLRHFLRVFFMPICIPMIKVSIATSFNT